jgi:hypothetical protein
MPAIASIEDSKAAHKGKLLSPQSSLLITDERWRKIGWKNVCELWLEERTPEQLKGEWNERGFGGVQKGEWHLKM